MTANPMKNARQGTPARGRSGVLLALLALAPFAACSDDGGSKPDGAAQPDSGRDTGRDASSDGGADSKPDGASIQDAARDEGSPDVAVDGGATGRDGAVDAVAVDGAAIDGSVVDGAHVPLDAGPGTDAEINLDETPIVARPLAGSYDCKVNRDRTSHSPRTWTGRAALQPLADGPIFFTRVEWETSTGPTGPIPRHFVASTFGLDGTLGTPTTIPASSPEGILALTSAPRGQGSAVAWADAQGLRFAAFDASGALVIQPKLITNLAIEDQIQLQMAEDRAGNGFAIALTTRIQQKLESQALFLDRDGVARGAPRSLTTATTTNYFFPVPYVAPATGGFVFVWNDPTGKSGRILFTRTDAAGTELVAPRAISFVDDEAVSVGGPGLGFERPGPRIVEMGSGFVAAWAEGRQGVTPDGGFSPSEQAGGVVRLTRLDGEGKQVGVSATLRALEFDIDEVEPVLTPFGDALGVSWSRGSHIYICGGCVPDHRIDFVLVDPNSFKPVSQVVTVTNGGGSAAGGLLRKQVAASGSSLLMVYDETFHTWATPGSLTYTCTK